MNGIHNSQMKFFDESVGKLNCCLRENAQGELLEEKFPLHCLQCYPHQDLYTLGKVAHKGLFSYYSYSTTSTQERRSWRSDSSPLTD